MRNHTVVDLLVRELPEERLDFRSDLIHIGNRTLPGRIDDELGLPLASDGGHGSFVAAFDAVDLDPQDEALFTGR